MIRAYITYFRHGEPFCYSTVGWLMKYMLLHICSPMRKIVKSSYLCPYGRTLFPLDIFSWNFVFEYFWTIVWRNSSFFKIIHEWQVFQLKTNIHFWWYHTSFFIEWEIFQKKVVDKMKTHFVFNNCFQNLCHLWDNVGKYCRVKTGHRWQYGACAVHAG